MTYFYNDNNDIVKFEINMEKLGVVSLGQGASLQWRFFAFNKFMKDYTQTYELSF
jgi:hypothetical protein